MTQEQTRAELIECMASGLRKMKFQPDYWLDCGIASQPEIEILGIPVIMTGYVKNEMSDYELPFIPCWNSTPDPLADCKRFVEGYTDCEFFKDAL